VRIRSLRPPSYRGTGGKCAWGKRPRPAAVTLRQHAARTQEAVRQDRTAAKIVQMAYDPDREWTPEDVPPPPYFHGTLRYDVGDELRTDVVNNIEGEEDGRLMCFATTSADAALQWAYSRGIRFRTPTLYVYEVEMFDPRVDVNMHRPGIDQEITSVMAPRGRVIGLVTEIAVADYPDALFG
jgi:hypothetical protein